MQEAEKKSLFGWWKKVLFENYANFNGRARRAEYWNYTLANFILWVPFYFLGIAALFAGSGSLAGLGLFVFSIGALGTFIPSLAVGVRRLHDLNKSGWNYLVMFIPVVGFIILIVWFFTEGSRGANEYGEDSKNSSGPVFEFEHANLQVQ